MVYFSSEQLCQRNNRQALGVGLSEEELYGSISSSTELILSAFTMGARFLEPCLYLYFSYLWSNSLLSAGESLASHELFQLRITDGPLDCLSIICIILCDLG